MVKVSVLPNLNLTQSEAGEFGELMIILGNNIDRKILGSVFTIKERRSGGRFFSKAVSKYILATLVKTLL